MKNYNKLKLPLLVFLFVAFNLVMVQLKIEKPMLMLERFFSGGGWIELVIISFYGAFIAYKMQDPNQSSKWRLISWSVFSIFFFTQLTLGILVSDTFLLTGKIHIPVPAMMISGPIYREQLSIMSLLFLSTLVLSGPAWCSHLCYFGALDGVVSNRKKTVKPPSFLKKLLLFKGAFLFILISTTIVLRYLRISVFTATIFGISVGIIGLIVIVILSNKSGKMIHCIAYCPIGTIVNFLKNISPFRMYIDKQSCTLCMKCTPACKYDALNMKNIERFKPGITCTLCGDCVSSCKDNAIKYKLFNLQPNTARNVYLFITISLHAIFMAMGRI